MFERASLRLAGWYLAILLAISLLFSGLVYQSATREVEARFNEYNTRLNANGYHIVNHEALQLRQLDQAKHNILINLLVINGTVAIVGGIASFFLAKRTLRPIQQAHESERRFVGDASHELRTPLAVMKTEIELALSDTHAKKSELRELLASNLDEVNRLSAMSHMLLSLSKREYSSLEFTRLEVMDRIHATLDYIEDVKRLRISEPKRPLYVMGNQPSLEELFHILIQNAFAYSPADSPVTIQTKSTHNSIIIAIANHGVGIKKSDLPHIFNRFYRGNSTRRNEAGFGLGVAIAKQIVDLHGGTIQASSTPDVLTTFTVILPRSR